MISMILETIPSGNQDKARNSLSSLSHKKRPSFPTLLNPVQNIERDKAYYPNVTRGGIKLVVFYFILFYSMSYLGMI